MDLRCGVMWAGEEWILVSTRTFGELHAMSPSPPISDVRLRALRAAAAHSREHFLSAVGDDDALRIWVGELTSEQIDRMHQVLWKLPG